MQDSSMIGLITLSGYMRFALRIWKRLWCCICVQAKPFFSASPPGRIRISLLPLLLGLILLAGIVSPAVAHSFMSDREIAVYQKKIAGKPVGARIALWAEKFIGTPYDRDPQGVYVTKKVIVADQRVDCMYLSFRAVELALSLKPAEAVGIALDKRFFDKGVLDGNGKVINYEDRFQYGEDMIDSGKWGEEITEELGEITEIEGSRGQENVKIISKTTLKDLLKNYRNARLFRSGDLIFFVRAVEKRKVGEIVGHIGIVKHEADGVYLIHASGVKNKGGEVVKMRLYDYIRSMPFVGIRVSRFN